MPHVREQIRKAAKTLVTGLATTGSRVYTGDPFAKSPDAGAFLVVAGPQEDQAPEWDDLAAWRGRRLVLAVLGYAQAVDIEDVLDDIAAEVEAVLDGQTFGGLAKDTRFARAVKTMDDDGRKRSGEVRLEFTVDYRIARGVPTTAVA